MTTLMPRAAAVLAMLCTMVACAKLETHHVITGSPSTPYDGDVRVVLEGAGDSGGIEEVAIVQAIGTLRHAKLEDLVSALKKDAQSLGCDVVVHVRIDQGSGMATASGVAGRSSALAKHGAPDVKTVPGTSEGAVAGDH